ncbi:hypothetical protein KP509_02G050900 [Ceratopteris richardii]|uniref:Anaphase-promoting complex subunit 4-like WD40 domain-containing protein n=1 Tax=Ceratopteris richardii TaxID=49495 RepID=A0A8T2V5N1_CERRI|nr:hypothetical protein KP509_02G050900 [Ceratopteris richardii]
MNLSLLDPFQNDFPEVIEEYLEQGNAKCVSFNRRGTLLAVGCADGTCVIWDFDTRGVAKEFRDPSSSASVTNVSWSKNGRYLLVAATDRSLALWDVASSTKVHAMTLQQTAFLVRVHPANPSLCLACPMSNAPILVDFDSNTSHALTVFAHKAIENGNVARSKASNGTPQFFPSVACFNKRGDLIFVGNSKGEVLITGTMSREVQAIVVIPGGAVVRHLSLSRSGQYLLIISNDRIIRLYEVLLPIDGASQAVSAMSDGQSHDSMSAEDLKQRGSKCFQYFKEFQDRVNRAQWRAACFSGDGEYVAGASAVKGEHKIHIWNSKTGQLARILEGPKEGLTDLAWHLSRPIVASVSMTAGVVYIWAKDYTENWSAFAPDFEELEENEEYVEREDEFDLMPETEKEKPSRVDEDEEVDIMTADKVAAFSDSDDSDDGLNFLPTVPLPDTPEQQNQVPQSLHVFEDSKAEPCSTPDSDHSNGADEDERTTDSQRKRKRNVLDRPEKASSSQKLAFFTEKSRSDPQVMMTPSPSCEELSPE